MSLSMSDAAKIAENSAKIRSLVDEIGDIAYNAGDHNLVNACFAMFNQYTRITERIAKKL